METKFCDEQNLYVYGTDRISRLINVGFPCGQENIHWIHVFDFFEKKFGLYGELLLDGWGDDNKVGYWESEQSHTPDDGPHPPCWRAFVWQIGKPKPGPADDLGCHPKKSVINATLIDQMLYMAEQQLGIPTPGLFEEE